MFETRNSDSQHLYMYTAYPAVNEPPAVTRDYDYRIQFQFPVLSEGVEQRRGRHK